ncbi:MAG: hypothetical protein AseanaTS_20960 [Candidatus Pelagadaptatus aseana]|uniref:DnaT-like ssDNA-binding domain-containing protein n=1 Tax=Candidatus Pelagadaptatus aseana TaxID=3120508 RepID=UPI0039B31110
MTSSLIPEHPILVSPSLAATIGLEEATLLSVLTEMTRYVQGVVSQGHHWYEVYGEQLEAALPFWQVHDIQRVSQALRAKGILLLQSAPYSESRQLIFAYNEESGSSSLPPSAYPHTQSAAPALPGNYTLGACPISPGWQPDRETLARIAQHNIPEEFIRAQVPEFVTFWRESGESHRSWGAKFLQRVQRNWAKHRSQQAWEDQQRDTDTLMHSGWQPSLDAMDIMTRQAGINRSFIEDAIPEFILYWSERGEKSRTWNTKFIQHVRRQWARFTAASEHEAEPRPIPENWQPGADVFDILRMANIDREFALQLLPEFIVFWRDSNRVYASWNTKFLQHVKYHWAQRHSLNTQQGLVHEGHPRGSQSGRTKDRSISEQLNDRSWAS